MVWDSVPSDAGAATSQDFDEVNEDGGVNGGVPSGARFVVSESVTTVGDIQTVTVAWTSVDLAGGLTPWVETGVVSPNPNLVFTSWRLDVGAIEGGRDPIDDPNAGYIAGSASFTGFNIDLINLGTFPLVAAEPAAGSSSLTGVVAA